MHREECNEIRIGTDLFYDTSFYHKTNKILDTTVITTYLVLSGNLPFFYKKFYNI